VKEELLNNVIYGTKFNYSLDSSTFNFNHYECEISLTNKEELVINTIKLSNFDGKQKKFKSSASTKIKDITNFIYGPFSSRFWIMRKNIITTPIS
jgi:hypothetical protein